MSYGSCPFWCSPGRSILLALCNAAPAEGLSNLHREMCESPWCFQFPEGAWAAAVTLRPIDDPDARKRSSQISEHRVEQFLTFNSHHSPKCAQAISSSCGHTGIVQEQPKPGGDTMPLIVTVASRSQNITWWIIRFGFHALVPWELRGNTYVVVGDAVLTVLSVPCPRELYKVNQRLSSSPHGSLSLMSSQKTSSRIAFGPRSRRFAPGA